MDADDRSHLVEAALNSSSNLQDTTPPTPSGNLDRISASSSGIGRSIDSDIMTTSTETNGNVVPSKEGLSQVKRPFTPPDGGCWAWLVMVSSFLVNGILFSIINCYGVIFVSLKEFYKNQGNEEAATRASFVGALAIGFTFLLSPVSSVLSDTFGLRKTAFIGGCLAFMGMLGASFSVSNIGLLCLTYGVMFGTGASLCYTPSLAILGHYFRRHLGMVNGVVAFGSSIFTIVMPHILKGLLGPLGLPNTLLFLAGMTFVLVIVTLSFKELMPKKAEILGVVEQNKKWWRKIINVDNWRNRKYVVWALVVPLALFGYFVPYVHIVEHVRKEMPGEDGALLITCIAITSAVGRILFGKIVDLPKVNGIILQQVSFFAIGTCTMLLTAAPMLNGFAFPAMIILTLIMGIFDGCFITMFGPIAFEICGPSGASQGIGFILGLCSVPLTIGPPVAGFLYDKMGNYTMAFLLAGCPPIIAAFLMCFIHRVRGTPPPDSIHGSRFEVEERGGEQQGGSTAHQRLLEEKDDADEQENRGQLRLHPTVTETTIVDNYDKEDNEQA